MKVKSTTWTQRHQIILRLFWGQTGTEENVYAATEKWNNNGCMFPGPQVAVFVRFFLPSITSQNEIRRH